MNAYSPYLLVKLTAELDLQNVKHHNAGVGVRVLDGDKNEKKNYNIRGSNNYYGEVHLFI